MTIATKVSLQPGIDYLRQHKDSLVEEYTRTLRATLPVELAQMRAVQSIEGLISRLEGRPLDGKRLEKAITAAIRSGENIESLTASANSMLEAFRHYIKRVSKDELSPELKELLINRATAITRHHLVNMQIISAKVSLERINNEW